MSVPLTQGKRVRAICSACASGPNSGASQTLTVCRAVECQPHLPYPCPCFCHRPHSALLGCRVGEAANPGPQHRQSCISDYFCRGDPQNLALAREDHADSQAELQPPTSATTPSASTTVHLAVINPTAVLHKEHALLAMHQDIFVVAETSAVEQAQRMVAGHLRPAGYTCLWSQPVAAHQAARVETSSLRGFASGVAVFSKFPARLAYQPLPAEVQASSRLLESYVRVGHNEFRLIVVYGYPANYHDAPARNELLLAEVLRRIVANPIPALIGGDFNTALQGLDIFQDFAHLGYVEAFQFWKHSTGQELPPTCKAATRNDTLLIPEPLRANLTALRVDQESCAFDSHSPLLTTFEFAGTVPCHRGWRMPRPWSPLT